MKLQKKWKYVVAFLVVLSAIYLTHPLYLKALGNFLYTATFITAHDYRFVIPAKAGIHTDTLDSHFRGNDNTFE